MDIAWLSLHKQGGPLLSFLLAACRSLERSLLHDNTVSVQNIQHQKDCRRSAVRVKRIDMGSQATREDPEGHPPSVSCPNRVNIETHLKNTEKSKCPQRCGAAQNVLATQRLNPRFAVCRGWRLQRSPFRCPCKCNRSRALLLAKNRSRWIPRRWVGPCAVSQQSFEKSSQVSVAERYWLAGPNKCQLVLSETLLRCARS